MDGEKNLKKRHVPKDLDKIISNGKELPSVDEFKFEARCKAEHP